MRTSSGYFQTVLSWWRGAWAVAVTGPLALWIPSLQPPWPEGSAVVVGIVFGIVALAVARVIMMPDAPATGKKAILRRRAKLTAATSFVFTLLMCVAYLFAYSMYVVSDKRSDGTRETMIRRVVGTELLNALDKGTSTNELLAGSAFEEDKVWTPASLTKARLLVLVPYAATFFFLCLGLGSLAALEDAPRTSRSSRRLHESNEQDH